MRYYLIGKEGIIQQRACKVPCILDSMSIARVDLLLPFWRLLV